MDQQNLMQQKNASKVNGPNSQFNLAQQAQTAINSHRKADMDFKMLLKG